MNLTIPLHFFLSFFLCMFVSPSPGANTKALGKTLKGRGNIRRWQMKNNHVVKDSNDKTVIVMLTLQEKDDLLTSPSNYAQYHC